MKYTMLSVSIFLVSSMARADGGYVPESELSSWVAYPILGVFLLLFALLTVSCLIKKPDDRSNG